MKILTVIVFIFISLSVSAQKRMYTIYQTPMEIMNMKLKTEMDSMNFKLDYTRYCMNQFRKEAQMSYGLIIGGAIIIVLTNTDGINGYTNAYNEGLRYHNWDKLNSIKTLKTAGLVVGIGAGLSGAALQVISYRWLGRAYIIPDRKGLTVGLKF
jgi:hypothetical protein